jgi:DNA-binding CsgD family transcriptional regulator/tetratricopeptide (TPR) repeat protein
MAAHPSTLVGRRIESTRLSRLWTEDAERALVVTGEPGVGKTALIEQMCARAAADGWQLVRVLGVAAEEPFALGGLNQLVLRLEEFVAGLSDKDRAVLAPAFGGEPDSAVAMLPLVGAVLKLLESAAQKQPVLLVVDDVHWLDSISAQVISAVGRRLTHPRVRVLAGQRVPHPSAFSSAGWGEVPLAPLETEDAEQLLELAGVPLPAATRAAVLTAAAGNPLALSELPRFAGLIDASSGMMPLTERMVAVFGARLEHLDADVRATLLRAALDGIAGSAVSASRARYVMRNVQPAIEAGLLVVDPLGQIVFRHPLVPAALVHQAGLQERRDAHRDLAALYENLLVRRASHLAAAATGPDQDVADLLDQAAQLSLRRGGLPAAISWLRQAAELSTDPHRRSELLAEAVFVATRAGRIDEAKDLLGDVEADATESALAALADCYRAVHADGETISTHRRLLDALTKADELDEQIINRLVNLLLYITGYADDDEQRELTNASLLPLRGRVHPAVLLYQTGVDDIAMTTKTMRSTLGGFVEYLQHVPARYVLMMSYPAYCIDAMDDFRAPLRQAFTELSDHGASIDAIEGGRVVLLDLAATGNWEQAQKVGEQCLEMAGQVQGSELLRQTFLADLGVLAACRGDLETARRYAAEVTAWSTPRSLNMLLRTGQRIAVRVALAEADYESAYQAATRISPPGQFPVQNIQVGDDMLDLVEAAVYTGRLAEARAHTAAAVRLNLADVSPRVAALTGAITAMTAPDSQAAGLFQSAVDHPGIAGFPFEHARIALAQGMWLRRKLHHTAARAPLGLAADIFDRLGARPWADRARSELRAAGAPITRTGEPTQLSTQERRVAEMAATGRTTKEIAAQLSLSPRTVDNHLHRAFRRLGVTNRAGLGDALKRSDSATGTT